MLRCPPKESRHAQAWYKDNFYGGLERGRGREKEGGGGEKDRKRERNEGRKRGQPGTCGNRERRREKEDGEGAGVVSSTSLYTWLVTMQAVAR